MGRDAASRQSRSVGMDGDLPGLPPVSGDTSTDVCVVGAGIAGLTTAWRVAGRGLDEERDGDDRGQQRSLIAVHAS